MGKNPLKQSTQVTNASLPNSSHHQLVNPQTEVVAKNIQSQKNITKNQALSIRNAPLLTPEATDFVKNFLKQKPDANVLEFGSGGSTIWMSKLTKKLVSIEHDTEWYNKVKNNLQQDTTCNPVDLRLFSRPYHGVCEQFESEFFDLIIVDGRDRMKCFEASIKLLKPGGILMLDDAQREKYKKAQDLLRDWQFTKTISKARDTYWWQKPFLEKKNLDNKYTNLSMSQHPYVFVIGLNKCGTTSLSQAFKELGWNSCHDPYKFNNAINKSMEQGKKLLDFLPKFNIFCDIFYPFTGKESPCMKVENRRQFLEMLDQQYPGSKFICNIRNKKDWLHSRKRHVQRNQKNPNYKLNWLKIEEDVWSQEYDIHYEIVFEYFKNRKDFLIIDFDEDTSYQTLCEFLEVPVLEKSFPKRGVTKK